MKNFLDFSQKTAIVTGGRRGIGRAMALALARHGAKVAIIAKDPDGREILNELTAAGTSGIYLSCDLADPSARANVIDRAVAGLGGVLDILINNAGIQFSETIESCTSQQWELSRSLLLDAPYELSRQAIPFLKARGGGKIILISSICALREGGGNFGYAVMKGGLATMARCMANSLAPHRINVNAIAPGIIRTELTEGQGCFEEERYQEIIRKYPAGRLGEPEEIAGAALFLASDLSSFVNGQQLVVDGGFSGN